MNNFFNQAFDYLINIDEGSSYTNKPTDAGGPTKYGITQKTLEEYYGRITTVDEVKNMSVGLAQLIYTDLYWEKLSCGLLTNVGVAIAIFESGVLYGIGTVAGLAQQSANNWGATIKIDRNLGEKSIAAINEINQEDFIHTFKTHILNRIDEVCAANPKAEVNREGWTNRANRLLTLIDLAPVIKET